MPYIDITETAEVNHEPLEPGTYPAVVRKATLAICESGKNVGKEKLDLIFRVGDKVTVRDTLIFSESMNWKSVAFAKATRFGTTGQRVLLDDTSVIGLTCNVQVIKTEFTKRDGTPGKGNEITRYMPAPIEIGEAPF